MLRSEQPALRCLNKTRIKWNGYQHYNGRLTFLLLVYAHDVYQRQNPKKKKVPGISFDTNESLNELDAQLIDDQNIIKQESTDSKVKGKAKVDKVKLPLTLVNKKMKKRKDDQEDLPVTKKKKKTRNENEELLSSFIMKKNKTKRSKGKKNNVDKKKEKNNYFKTKKCRGLKDKHEEDKKEDTVQVQEMTEISPAFLGELIQAVENVESEHNKDVKELNELSSSLVDEMIEAVDKVEADHEVKVDEDDDKIGDLIANLEFLSSNEADCQQTNKKSNEEKETDDEILFIKAKNQRIREILFDTSINNKFAKISFESFYPKQYIHIGVMSCWSNVLNHEEQFKSKDSTSRLFCPCNMLEEKDFKARMRLNELLINLETNLESTLLSLIYKSIEDVDILIVPILQVSQYYLICFNFKNETIDVIDNMKGKMKPKQKYRVTRMLLLSDINLLRDKVMSQLEDFEKIDISEREKLKKGAEKRIIKRIKKYC
ncbi:hypothetical protein E3N88_18214 [Mikania micrantha]|uniref:Ubiquitin-like protease family profile domain-containing protein n=1 Tax=Mikania micrantha TaxID=192012 RepID=A0A5N6NWS8_9ASTR|nr:hypothetical protein E3N88_18214 [Mikania micrantha]